MHERSKLLLWIVLALVTRLLPHPPNFTPYASLIMLMGYQLTRRSAIVATMVSLAFSDLLLAFIFNYSVFGLWSLFTYSGFIAISYASTYLQKCTVFRIGFFAFSSTLLYWLWTNFGTWCVSGMYAHSLPGLVTCFVAGLPFLQTSLLSTLIFVPLFFGLITFMERSWALKPR